jgi:hypothetical protein
VYHENRRQYRDLVVCGAAVGTAVQENEPSVCVHMMSPGVRLLRSEWKSVRVVPLEMER